MRSTPRVSGDAPGAGGPALRRELQADVGQHLLLALVEHREGVLDAPGVLGEQAIDQLATLRGEAPGGGSSVWREAEALDHPARLQGRQDLGRVGLRRAQLRPQAPELQLAARL